MSGIVSRFSKAATAFGGNSAFRKLTQQQPQVPVYGLRRFASKSSATSTSNSTPVVEQVVGNESGTVQVTESCAKRLVELTQNAKDQFLRVSVEGGGCSGFQYKFEIDSKTNPDDKTFTHPQYKSAIVVVDSTSLEYLKGSTVDFHVELIRSAFRVVSNPKAEHGCSCGASFTVKID